MNKLIVRALCALVVLTTTLAMAAGLPEAKFKFQTFTVSGNTDLSVEQINDWETVVGFYSLGTTATPGPFRGFAYFPVGPNFVALIDPNGTVTQAFGENNLGTIVGQFLDSESSNAGFILNNGNYRTYTVPGYTDTTLTSINDEGDFAGWLQNGTLGFTVVRGKLKLITIPGSSLVEPYAINDSGVVSGSYLDSSTVWHGFLIDARGNFTTIDVPGASTVVGLGTISLGLNNLGVVSGHFYDISYNEHGFLRTPNGDFYQVDVPGALETSGGGVNDFDLMVGHFLNSSGTEVGYIAVPY